MKNILTVFLIFISIISCKNTKELNFVELSKSKVIAYGQDKYSNYFFVNRQFDLFYTDSGDEVIDEGDKFIITLNKNPIVIKSNEIASVNNLSNGTVMFSLSNGLIIKTELDDKIEEDLTGFVIKRAKVENHPKNLDTRKVEKSNCNNDCKLIIKNIKSSIPQKHNSLKIIHDTGEMVFPQKTQLNLSSIKYSGKIIINSIPEKDFYITSSNSYYEYSLSPQNSSVIELKKF